MEFAILKKEIFMQDNGKMIKWRETEAIFFKTVTYTQDKFKEG